MIDLFTKTALDDLRIACLNKPLIAFDFDGTLAAIVSDPPAAKMLPSIRSLLVEVATLYPTVVISGRLRADLEHRLVGIPLRAVVGNHGMEPEPGMIRPLAKKWLALFAPLVHPASGIFIEDKGLTMAIHYRHAKNESAARATILNIATSIADAQIIEGKCVVNLLPIHASNKAQALLTLWQRFHCHRAIFVGDDDTDESVFELCTKGMQLLGIHVGYSQHSHAQYYLKNQRTIDRLLKQLLSLRTKVSGASPSLEQV